MSLQLDAAQRAAWTAAQKLWDVSMHEVVLAPNSTEPSFAWFSFPPTVTVDPVQAAAEGVAGEWETIFAHELGHHVLAPSTRVDQFKIVQQMARCLVATSVEPPQRLAARAAYMSNVWCDLLINVRVAELQRREDPTVEPGMLRMWRILTRVRTPEPGWWIIMRAYEELWGLPDGTLCDAVPPPVATTPGGVDYTSLFAANPVVDASLIADTVRAFGADPIRGALRFGMVLAPYLLAAAREQSGVACAGDTTGAPATAEELAEVMRDGRLSELPEHPATAGKGAASEAEAAAGQAAGQGYGLSATLQLYGTSAEDVVLRAWYIAAARPFVAPYTQRLPGVTAVGLDLPGPLEPWLIEDELDRIDWPATIGASPRVVPGVTTRWRTEFSDEAPDAQQSVHLDLYIDSSGSMTSPRQESPAVLAGTILILSVLRGGGRVRVTSFSGPGQVSVVDSFSRDRDALLAGLLTYFGGGTTFPLDLLAARYRSLPRSTGVAARRHLVVLSDDGLSSLFAAGQPGLEHVAKEVRSVLDTGTLIVQDAGHSIEASAAEAGYQVEYIESMLDAPAACARLARRLVDYRPREAARG